MKGMKYVMEITKDVMFKMKFKQDKYIAKINKEANKKKGFIYTIKTHKLFTFLCIMAIGLVGTDIFLINRFINLMKQI